MRGNAQPDLGLVRWLLGVFLSPGVLGPGILGPISNETPQFTAFYPPTQGGPFLPPVSALRVSGNFSQASMLSTGHGSHIS